MIMGIKKKSFGPVIVRYHGKTVTLKLKKRRHNQDLLIKTFLIILQVQY